MRMPSRASGYPAVEGADSSPKILFVDDKDDIFSEYQELVETIDPCSLCESDPIRAIRTVCGTHSLQLVITDLHMSNMDGDAMIARIREAIPAPRSVQFILLTGGMDVSPALWGADIPVFQKPIDPSEFLQAVETALYGRRQSVC